MKNPYGIINDTPRTCYHCGKPIKRGTYMIVSGRMPFHRACYKRAEAAAARQLKKKNPHRSHARVSAARSAATTKIFAEARRIHRLAVEAEKMGVHGVARGLYKKRDRLLKAANKSGGQEGPVGRLPNPTVEFWWQWPDGSMSRYKFNNKAAANKALARLKRLGGKKVPAPYSRKNPIRLSAADIARLPQKAQEQIKRELERDEPPIIRRPLRTPSFDSMPLLSQIPKGASRARLKSGQVVSRVRRLNRAKNFGIIDLASGLQAEDYLEKRLLGKKRRNPGGADSSVRSPTRTSTEVRSPTKTSTRAYTSGNVTVTGGAGAGANTTVKIIARKGNPDAEKMRRIKQALAETKAIVKKLSKREGQSPKHLRSQDNMALISTYRAHIRKLEGMLRKANPSVSDLSQTFQGKATGAVSSFKASNSAPSDLARIGKLVFLKLAGGKQTRVPGAMVAVDTKGKLWIVGNRTPLFSRKAKPGEALDFGDVNQICYATAKKHIEAGRMTEYVHSFGEEGGRKPRLLIDSEGMPILRGGDYQIKSEGIVD